MRRKSSRNATAKASPEKLKEEKPGRSRRRNSRQRRKQSSSASGSDSETERMPHDGRKSADGDSTSLRGSQSSADIKRSKTTVTPLPSTRRLRKRSVSSIRDEDVNSSDKMIRRTTRGRGASPKKEEPLKEESEDEESEEIKGKGKSKGKTKSKFDRNQQSETELQTELVQVTAQSPQTDKIDNNDVDDDLNQNEDAANIVDADNKNNDCEVVNSPAAPEMSPVRTEDSNDNIVEQNNERPIINSDVNAVETDISVVDETLNESFHGFQTDESQPKNDSLTTREDIVIIADALPKGTIIKNVPILDDTDVSMKLETTDLSIHENPVEHKKKIKITFKKDKIVCGKEDIKKEIVDRKQMDILKCKKDSDNTSISVEKREKKIDESSEYVENNENAEVDGGQLLINITFKGRKEDEEMAEAIENKEISKTEKDDEITKHSKAKNEEHKDHKDRSKRRETHKDDKRDKTSKHNEEDTKKSSEKTKISVAEPSEEKNKERKSRIKISMNDGKERSENKEKRTHVKIDKADVINHKEERHSSRSNQRKKQEETNSEEPKKPAVKVVPKIRKLSEKEIWVESPKKEAVTAPETEEEDIVKEPREKVRTRKWGKEQVSLNTLTNQTFEITLESISGIYPDLSLLEETDIRLEEAPYKSRRRSSAYSSDVDVPHSKERKVSVEDRPMKYESQTSESDTREEIIQKIPIDDNIIAMNRKISIVDDSASKLKPPPSPAKHDVSEVLFISNLVRPFTLKQLKELLERTGKIKEEGFWTDRIKSKCYVSYETSEEAEATRNALHGVHWPIGNGKKLMIDFATADDLEAAKNPPVIVPIKIVPVVPVQKENQEPVRERERDLSKRTKEEIEDEKDRDRKRRSNPQVREWDMGKEEQHHNKRRSSRSRSRDRGRDRSQKRRRSRERRTRSPSDDFGKRKQKKIEDAIPQRAMDDLFRKTETTPCIYWQPLTPEEIALKQQQRMERMEEHKRRMAHTTNTPHSNRGNRGSDHARGGPYRRRY